jgi:FkbM family methyltransferase
MPVRGIGPLTNMVLGAPRMDAPSGAIATIAGVSFELDLRQALHRVVFLDLFSIELRRTVLPLLAADELLVDVGANFGFWTLLAARRGCRVLAVEPVPATRTLLAANAARNGLEDRIEIVGQALSDSPGTLTLALPDGESGQASVHPDTTATGAERFTVPSSTLDALLGERRVRLLKIDVEGHELAVLAGASRVLASGQVDYLLVEVAGAVLERAHGSSEALVELLTGHGYTLVRFVLANEGLFPRRSYRRVGLAELRGSPPPGDALWVRKGLAHAGARP